MLRVSKPTDRQIERHILAASLRAQMEAKYLDVSGGVRPIGLPNGFVLDRLSSRVGTGEEAFACAVQALLSWTHFDLGWIRVANGLTPIEIGRIVAVEVHSLGLWSLNLSQIVEVIQTANRFGFIYKTTPTHVEEGEERFEVVLDSHSGGVWYETEAVSRPRDLLALAGYPVTRAFQRRFARDSHRRIRESISGQVSV